jgi:hypothetical protein
MFAIQYRVRTFCETIEHTLYGAMHDWEVDIEVSGHIIPPDETTGRDEEIAIEGLQVTGARILGTYLSEESEVDSENIIDWLDHKINYDYWSGETSEDLYEDKIREVLNG